MEDSIIAKAVKDGFDRPKYDGFFVCANLTSDILEAEKDTLMKRMESGEYLNQEEQFHLAKLSKILAILNSEYNKFRF